MSIVFDTANKDDIEELIRLRIAYMVDDFGVKWYSNSSWKGKWMGWIIL